jgi:hypothetical protein
MSAWLCFLEKLRKTAAKLKVDSAPSTGSVRVAFGGGGGGKVGKCWDGGGDGGDGGGGGGGGRGGDSGLGGGGGGSGGGDRGGGGNGDCNGGDKTRRPAPQERERHRRIHAYGGLSDGSVSASTSPYDAGSAECKLEDAVAAAVRLEAAAAAAAAAPSRDESEAKRKAFRQASLSAERSQEAGAPRHRRHDVAAAAAAAATTTVDDLEQVHYGAAFASAVRAAAATAAPPASALPTPLRVLPAVRARTPAAFAVPARTPAATPRTSIHMPAIKQARYMLEVQAAMLRQTGRKSAAVAFDGVGPRMYFSPRHRMLFNLRN